jgi:hypothetical protein
VRRPEMKKATRYWMAFSIARAIVVIVSSELKSRCSASPLTLTT